MPELSEPEVLYHYLRLSQQTLGMMNISLFGTCTMKYNAQINEAMAWRPEITHVHPHQDEDTLQGALEVVHGMDTILRELSGMDQFIFQAGGGADAAYTSCAVTRAYHAPGANWSSVTRSSPPSRRTPAAPRRQLPPGSRSSP